MTLILSNDDIDELLPMADCLERLDEAYKDMGERRAMSRPRADIYGPVTDNGRYIFKTMDGMAPRYEVAAIRLNSDTIKWTKGPGGIKKDKQPVADGKWVGLVMLFSTRTGEPLAIMPDGVMQRLRVASTNALGAKYMTAPDASVYALMGSGWQASGQALAMAQVRPLKEIRVYSPTEANREKLAAELRAQLGIEVVAAPDVRSAVKGADIVGMATNCVTPVVEHRLLAPHAHVTCVKELELDPHTLDASGLVVVHTRIDRPANYIIGESEDPIYDHDPQQGIPAEFSKERASRPASKVDLTKCADLGELAVGKVQLPPAGRMTTFVNTIGLGLQFAALGELAYSRAREQGKGREIPTDWLLETVHP
jgi:ornithine cyclodeaminase/alanine dehydrogenase-like protein (mu-crystallin family)